MVLWTRSWSIVTRLAGDVNAPLSAAAGHMTSSASSTKPQDEPLSCTENARRRLPPSTSPSYPAPAGDYKADNDQCVVGGRAEDTTLPGTIRNTCQRKIQPHYRARDLGGGGGRIKGNITKNEETPWRPLARSRFCAELSYTGWPALM